MTLKLIMPMAGEGSRFSEQGYPVPKPLIDINGKPMFVRAIESIDLTFDDYVFIVRKEHNIKNAIYQYYPTAKVIEIDELTEGAACTVLLAGRYIDDDDAVLVTNCDQLIEWDSTTFDASSAGNILCFHDPDKDPKWSFAQVDENNNVKKVAEKNPISEWATSGHYYWKNWRNYKDAAAHMISANDRTNGEFYLCPVYNYTIGTIKMTKIDRMHGLGTPEDLEKWLTS